MPLATRADISTVADLEAIRTYSRNLEIHQESYPEPKKTMPLHAKITLAVGLGAGAFLTGVLIFSPLAPLALMGAGSTAYLLSGLASNGLLLKNRINPSTTAIISTVAAVVAIATVALAITTLGLATPFIAIPTAIAISLGMVGMGTTHYLTMKPFDNLQLNREDI